MEENEKMEEMEMELAAVEEPKTETAEHFLVTKEMTNRNTKYVLAGTLILMGGCWAVKKLGKYASKNPLVRGVKAAGKAFYHEVKPKRWRRKKTFEAEATETEVPTEEIRETEIDKDKK